MYTHRLKIQAKTTMFTVLICEMLAKTDYAQYLKLLTNNSLFFRFTPNVGKILTSL